VRCCGVLFCVLSSGGGGAGGDDVCMLVCQSSVEMCVPGTSFIDA